LHNANQCELPESAFHLYVLYFFSIVFKTRKSVEEYKTGYMGSCESQTEACCTGSTAVCFAATGYFEMRMGKLE